jgi:Zn-dependent protease with chaperone function
MNLLLIAPLGLTVVGIAAGWFLPRFASPVLWVRVLTATTVIAAASVSAALLLVAATGASELPAVSDLVGWCEALTPGDHGAAPWIGFVAATAAGLATWRARRHLALRRDDRARFANVDGVHVIAAGGPVAFAVPGSPGGIVLGDQLLASLDATERRVVLAHEQAHLDFGHHRYIHIAEVCAAAFPFLAPLARQVRFGTERWADEAAADRVGSRRDVACAIARVALLGQPDTAPLAGLGFRGSGAGARVDALLRSSRPRLHELPFAAASVTVLPSLAGSAVQVHHLAEFVAHAC